MENPCLGVDCFPVLGFSVPETASICDIFVEILLRYFITVISFGQEIYCSAYAFRVISLSIFSSGFSLFFIVLLTAKTAASPRRTAVIKGIMFFIHLPHVCFFFCLSAFLLLLFFHPPEAIPAAGSHVPCHASHRSPL